MTPTICPGPNSAPGKDSTGSGSTSLPRQQYTHVVRAFWIETRFGRQTLGYHLVNIFLHAMSAPPGGGDPPPLAVPGAYLAAAIFALHPVCVESVAWITELKHPSGVFYLGALLVYLHFDRTRKASRYRGALGLFLLALLSKTAVVMLPAVLLVIFWWQRGRLSWIRDVLPLAPFFLAGPGRHDDRLGRAPRRRRGRRVRLRGGRACLIAGRAVWFYLGKLAWPLDLVFNYPRWQVSRDQWWQFLFPAAALLLLAAAWRLRGVAGAPGGPALLCRNVIPGAGLHQCLFL